MGSFRVLQLPQTVQKPAVRWVRLTGVSKLPVDVNMSANCYLSLC